jgi:hypothetical protein
MNDVHDTILEEGCHALFDPQIIPPVWRNKVAKPLQNEAVLIVLT